MDDEGDIDYFIITKPNRLWIARTLLILYKKLFLFNSRKYFCVNYFIDTEDLLIKEQNLFTATEIATVLPMVNANLYSKFKKENDWVKSYYPLANDFHFHTPSEVKKTGLAKLIQWMFKGGFGEWADKKMMKKTLKRWQKKFGNHSKEDFELIMKSNRRVSKHHPSNYQKMVLEAYEKNLDKYCRNEIADHE